VYSFGPKKPPYCMSCAMVAGGVRSGGAMPAMPKRQLKAQMRAVKAAAKAEAKGKGKGKGKPESPDAADAAAAFAPTDWSTPWWEDRQPTALAD
jgi:hypothetical protein